jgi:hypothetical protein
MPPGRHLRVHSPYARALDLPPPFRPVKLREVGDAFAHARAHAAELGAGTLIFVGRFDLAEFAVVLEPDETLAFAWRAFYAGMAALADALATVAPPEKPIAIGWPDAIRLDGGLVGGGRLAWPDGADQTEPPPWLVFGAMIRTMSMAPKSHERHPHASALEDEGFEHDGSDLLVESFARHLMQVSDHWRETGFTAVANKYVSWLAQKDGGHCIIGDDGGVLVMRNGAPVERHLLPPKLAAPSWLDPRSGGPRA